MPPIKPLPYLFFDQGHRDIIESVRYLRLAKIVSVDVEDMVAEIELLGETSGKTRVPLPMPMAYPGGGVFAVPSRGAIVVVGVRAMQMPIILSYYPYNVFTPDSYFAASKQLFGIPENLEEGDVFIRARSDSARCDVCNEESPVEEFEAAVDQVTRLEACPRCLAPAAEYDERGEIRKLNKHQLGMTLHMRSDGMFFLQADNLTSADRGHDRRLFKLAINGITGEVGLDGVSAFRLMASDNVTFQCKKFTVNASEAIEENTDSRVYQNNSDAVENAKSRIIEVLETLTLSANTIALQAAGFARLSADSRQIKIADSDVYSAGSTIVNISGTRLVNVGGDDDETVGSPQARANKDLTVNGNLGTTVVGGAKLSVTDSYEVTVMTNMTQTVTGTYGVSAGGDISIASAAVSKLNGTQVIFNDGTLAVARQTDPTLIDNTTASTFFTFLSAVKTAIDEIRDTFNAHTHAALGSPPATPITATVPTAPTTVAGKIDGGNNTVLA